MSLRQVVWRYLGGGRAHRKDEPVTVVVVSGGTTFRTLFSYYDSSYHCKVTGPSSF